VIARSIADHPIDRRSPDRSPITRSIADHPITRSPIAFISSTAP
jgi:hypothetical protein